MPCYRPLKAFQEIIDKKSRIVFDERKLEDGLYNRPISLACGQCIGCRLDRSRVWALRCCHEASLHETNSFITLTFNPHEFPEYFHNLDNQVFVNFMKRLRITVEREYGIRGLRFFHCGEYGAPQIDPDSGIIQRFRHAHHHFILFGFDFPDKELFSMKGGTYLYRSAFLERLWSDPKTGRSYGFSSIGNVTFDSCAYVARYVTKKVTGQLADDWYGDTKREYLTMSRRPGIAREWIEKFYSDVYPKDFITFNNGLKLNPPKYYDRIYDMIDHNEMERIKDERQERFEEVIITPEYVREHTPERLSAKESAKVHQFSKLVRSLENQFF